MKRRYCTIRNLVFAGAASALAASASQSRIGIIIFPASQTQQVTFDATTPGASVGWSITASATPFIMLRDVVGDIVQRPITLRSAGATTVIIVEIFEGED